jgi:hypothetical protein
MHDPISTGDSLTLLQKIMVWMPFLGLSVGSQTQELVKHPLVIRLAEAAIIGAIMMTGVVKVLGERVDTLKTGQSEMKEEVRSVARTVDQVKIDVAVLKAQAQYQDNFIPGRKTQ